MHLVAIGIVFNIIQVWISLIYTVFIVVIIEGKMYCISFIIIFKTSRLFVPYFSIENLVE